MLRKAVWAAGILAIAALAVIALMGAQTNVAQDATIQDLLDLLLTEEGESRLDQMQATLNDIDNELDLVHSVAEKMLEEQYGIFDTQEWSLSDIKYQLNQIQAQLDEIEACSCP